MVITSLLTSQPTYKQASSLNLRQSRRGTKIAVFAVNAHLVWFGVLRGLRKSSHSFGWDILLVRFWQCKITQQYLLGLLDQFRDHVCIQPLLTSVRSEYDLRI